MIPRVIGLVGEDLCGKTTVARWLADQHSFTRHSTTGPVKRMLMRELGLTEAQLWGDNKDIPIPGLGRTPRDLICAVMDGTQAVDPDYWARMLGARINRDVGRCVVDDVRYPNVASVVTRAGGVLWRIKRDPIARPRLYGIGEIPERDYAEIITARSGDVIGLLERVEAAWEVGCAA